MAQIPRKSTVESGLHQFKYERVERVIGQVDTAQIQLCTVESGLYPFEYERIERAKLLRN